LRETVPIGDRRGFSGAADQRAGVRKQRQEGEILFRVLGWGHHRQIDQPFAQVLIDGARQSLAHGHIHPRPLVAKAAEHLRQIAHRIGRQHAQHHPPALARQGLAKLVEGLVEIGDQPFGQAQQILARRGQRDMAAVAVEQAAAKVFLQQADGA
jgi:hypothetical protein